MFNNSISHPTETNKSDCHTDSLNNDILETKIVFPEKNSLQRSEIQTKQDRIKKLLKNHTSIAE